MPIPLLQATVGRGVGGPVRVAASMVCPLSRRMHVQYTKEPLGSMGMVTKTIQEHWIFGPRHIFHRAILHYQSKRQRRALKILNRSNPRPA